MRRAVAAVVTLAAAALAGCSSAEGEKHDQRLSSDATVCARDAHAVGLPKGFPADFPLPPGTVVTRAEDRGEDGLVVIGVTAGRFASVLHDLQTALPKHGFVPDDGEVEPHDAESDWRSTDYDGRWAIRELAQCNGDTAVSVVARHR